MKISEISLAKAIGWRVQTWQPVVEWALEQAKCHVGENSNVLELGFGDGVMSCYLAQTHGWNIQGFEIRHVAFEEAQKNKRLFRLEDKVSFDVKTKEEILKHDQLYDAIFIKSVFFFLKTEEEYVEWLSWAHKRLRPGGVLILLENGAGNFPVRFIRKHILKHRWKNNIMFSGKMMEKALLLFPKAKIKHFGWISPLIAKPMSLHSMMRKIENQVVSLSTDNCFITAFIGKKEN